MTRPSDARDVRVGITWPTGYLTLEFSHDAPAWALRAAVAAATDAARLRDEVEAAQAGKRAALNAREFLRD